MNGLRLLITAVISATLIACEETPNTTTQDAIIEAGFFAKFSPSDSVIPFPNNLLFQSTAPDGTLNIPIPEPDTTCPNDGEIAVKTALNDLDGFSTVAPISTSFSSAIDTTSLVAGTSVRVFTVSLGGSGEVTGITGELTAAEFAVGVSSVNNEIVNAACDTEDLGANKLVIAPLKPLAPKTSYLVALSKAIKAPNGNNAAADAIYAFTKSPDPLITGATLADIQFTGLLSTADADGNGTIDAAEETAIVASITSLEGLRQLTNASEAWIEAYTVTIDNAGAATITDLAASDIILSWTFTTQSAGDVLTALHTKIQTDPVPVSSINPTAVAQSPQDGVTGFVGSDIYIGELTLPYYLNVPANANDSSVLTGSWRGAGGTPLTQYNTAVDPATSTPVTVPLLISIPNGTEPGTGWPVVIYQHGITKSRGTMLGIADAMANIGYAVVAIDMPLHGLLGGEDLIGAFKDATEAYSAAIHGTATVKERTFDLDIFDAAISTTDADGDGTTDDSGAHFINLPSLLTSRDNVRQAVADLFSLKRALSGMDYNGGTAGGIFDSTNIHFVGHSLGGIVGGVFLAIEGADVKSSVLAMSGGGIAKLLDGSAAFGPVVSAGLAANDVNKGFAQYESFLASAQMALDSADPINYTTATAANRGVLLFEVIGDGVDNLPDQVIPNNVIGVSGTVNAPLSGTDPIIVGMGLTQLSASDTAVNLGVTQIDAVVKYTAGHHGSILTPDDAVGVADLTSAAVLTEMQTEMASFIVTDGAAITIVDDTVIDVPAAP